MTNKTEVFVDLIWFELGLFLVGLDSSWSNSTPSRRNAEVSMALMDQNQTILAKYEAYLKGSNWWIDEADDDRLPILMWMKKEL